MKWWIAGWLAVLPAQGQDCGCESGPLPEVLAVAAGVRITRTEVNAAIEPKVRELYRQVVEMRNRELQVQINSRLVEAEARKRGVSVTTLLEQEVISKVPRPAEAEAREKATSIEKLLDQRQKELASKWVGRLRAAADVKVLAQAVAPPVKESDRARVMATVNGRPITSGDIEDALRPLLYQAQLQLYNLRKSVLDPKINGILLSQEAQRRKITVDALIAEEVTPKLQPVAETDALAFFRQNQNRLDGAYEQLKDSIVQHLQNEEQRKTEEAFAALLRKSARLEVFLKPPVEPSYSISTSDQPARGRPDAPVTLVLFTDYECPSCAELHPVLEKLREEFKDQVRLVVKDFPLSQHVRAFKAAEAAEAARVQGKYWEFARKLYASQPALSVDNLKTYARELGLDLEPFEQALDSAAYSAAVERDLNEGRAIGVESAPAVFVNGRRVTDKSYESLKRAIQESRTRSVAASAPR